MDLFHREDLRTLASHADAPCVTLMMPTARVEAEMAQNPIRLKNLLRKAGEELKQQGYRDEVAHDVLSTGRELMGRDDFWRKLNDGLAVFLSRSESRVYRLPIDLQELVVVSNRFHLKPLFPLIAGNNRFYLLALSKNRVQLFLGTHFSMTEVHDSDIPKSLTEALFTDMPQATVKGPVGAKQHRGRQEMTYHGHGQAATDYRSEPQEELKRFFKKINDAVANVVRDDDAPMLLAGVAHYMPIYREVNTYRPLIEDELVPGNWEHLTPKEIHARAWQVVEPIFLSSQTTSIDRFNHLVNNGENLASTDLREIVSAAVFHRVDTLFVPIGAHQWGRFDYENNVVELHEKQEPGDEDLLDLAAVHTYLNGGTVHALQQERMPGNNGFVAATFRYSPGAPAEIKSNGHQHAAVGRV